MRTNRVLFLGGLALVAGACSSNGGDSSLPTGSAGNHASKGGSSAATSGEDSAAGGGENTEQAGAGASEESGGTENQGSGGTPGQSSGGSALGTGGSNSPQTGGAPGTGATPTGGSNEGGSCADLQAATKALPPVLEFAIDITGSMANQPAYPGQANSPSKWAEMVRVLPTAFASLPLDWAVGVSYFSLPVTGTTVPQCFSGRQVVPIAPLTSAQLTLLQNSVGAQTPSGATPTGAAWRFALSQISSWTAPPAYANSSRYIVLITDGIPTINNDGCFQGMASTSNGADAIAGSEYDAMITFVGTEGSAANVQTFVVGVLGSEIPQGAFYDPLYKLSQLAVAGGTAQPKGCTPTSGTSNGQTLTARGSYCHFDMTTNSDFAVGLTDALSAIRRNAVSCSYDVPTPSDGRMIDPNKVKITYITGAGEERALRRATDSSCVDGQWFVSASDSLGIPTKLELCPSSCDTVAADAGAAIQVTFTCFQQV